MAHEKHVFISYKTEEWDKAEEIRKQVTAWGYPTWMDVHNILPGSSWADEIDQAVKTARAVLGIMTPAALASRNVTNEWDLAIVKGVPFIPLLHTPCDVHYKYRSYAVRSIFPVGAQCVAPLPSVNCVSPKIH
jgi:hypothetical protein